MKLQFDPNQPFQLEAVAAVADLFAGQPQSAPEYSQIQTETIGDLYSFYGQSWTELGVGNQLLLSEDKLLANTRTVQIRNDIEVTDPSAPLEGWELVDTPTNTARSCPHFSVEMETGTGKTYVYLRTIFELSRRYGFRKFVIVVPSVAIREGTLKNIDITREHFRSIYTNPTFEHFVYDGKKVNRLRQFAVSNTLQILIINIDAFRKNFTGTEEEQKSNVIYKESDKLSGRQPIEFVQAARPIVIIDEPQSVDATERSQEAIKALNPLCTLRYSATHRNPYNLIYRLDPLRAFELGLVKQIVVSSASVDGGMNDAFVRVERIDHRNGIKAKLRIQAQTPNGPREKGVTAKLGDDLRRLSNERACYQNGFEITEINAAPGNKYVRFSGGFQLSVGQELGGYREEIWRAQIRRTVKKHLEKEVQATEQGIKVLSLFFIDRVANYRDYDAAGRPLKGKFALEIEAALKGFAEKERYKAFSWLKLSLDRLHDGYFAQDKKGLFKDTSGRTQTDDKVYDLIMKDKERLLLMDEPLRFIFSHSALREGWDNPNVFQICTLNMTQSAVKKRQEIGRGLRLPVNQKGERVFDESVNRLSIMANESYEDFARALQTEYEEDCGVTFGKVPLMALAKITRRIDGEERPIGQAAAQSLHAALVDAGMLDEDGRILPAFDPKRRDFRLDLPQAYADLAPAVVDILANYPLERHIRRDRDEGPNRLKKHVQLSDEFQALWDRIKPKTTFRVEFTTDDLVRRAVKALRAMEKIAAPAIRVIEGELHVTKAGIGAQSSNIAEEAVSHAERPLPDVLAYLQNETELTRSTLARILKESDRLSEFLVDPQRFMDAVAAILKHELRRLLVDGIKYERIQGSAKEAQWDMTLFRDEELINYLSALSVNKSVYEYVVYDSETEREFAHTLDQRDDIKLFVKLPGWFKIDTPIGGYNPDWAIVKHNDETLYLVRETKGTRDFLKLRTSEADKARCGYRHFEELGVSFAVAESALDV